MAQRTAKAELGGGEGGQRVNQYRIVRECGQGTFCNVQWAEDAEQRRFAVKVFDRGELRRRPVSKFTEEGATTVPLEERVEEEIRLLAELRHPSIVALAEVIDDPAMEQLFVVLEGLPGGQIMTWEDDLFAYSLGGASSSAASVGRLWGSDVLSSGTDAAADCPIVYQEAAAAHLLPQLLSGVEFMHARRVVHKDLKPDNVLLTLPPPAEDRRFARRRPLGGWPAPGAFEELPGGGEASLPELLGRRPWLAKICDFNSAVMCPTEECLIHDAEGTQCFTPPECFDPCREGGIRGRPRDMWSVGCLLFVLLFGRCPYWDEVPIKMQMDILYGELQLPSGLLSPAAEALIRALMAKDPGERPTAAEAAAHAFLAPPAAA